MHAALDVAARLDGVERRTGRELLRRSGGTREKGRKGGDAADGFHQKTPRSKTCNANACPIA
jgi:hypothetical protein